MSVARATSRARGGRNKKRRRAAPGRAFASGCRRLLRARARARALAWARGTGTGKRAGGQPRMSLLGRGEATRASPTAALNLPKMALQRHHSLTVQPGGGFVDVDLPGGSAAAELATRPSQRPAEPRSVPTWLRFGFGTLSAMGATFFTHPVSGRGAGCVPLPVRPSAPSLAGPMPASLVPARS
jgi:hypothetical protein